MKKWVVILAAVLMGMPRVESITIPRLSFLPSKAATFSELELKILNLQYLLKTGVLSSLHVNNSYPDMRKPHVVEQILRIPSTNRFGGPLTFVIPPYRDPVGVIGWNAQRFGMQPLMSAQHRRNPELYTHFLSIFTQACQGIKS